MSMKVVPTAAVLGAEIAGVDLSRTLDDPTFAAIERAYNEYGVIFFRGQSGRVRFPGTQAGPHADSGGNRPQSPGSPSDRADSPVDRSQVPLRDARRLHRPRGDGARRGGGVDRGTGGSHRQAGVRVSPSMAPG